jgi:hypothetical protein
MVQILGLLKYKLLSYYCQSLVPWWLFKSWKYLNTRYLSITAELMEATFLTCLLRSVNLFSIFLLSNHCFTGGRNQSLYRLIRRTIKQTAVIIDAKHSNQLHANIYPAFFLTLDTSSRRNGWRWSVWVWTLLIKTNHIFCFQVLEKKNKNTMKKWINYLQTSRKPRILLQGRFPTILFSLVHS